MPESQLLGVIVVIIELLYSRLSAGVVICMDFMKQFVGWAS
jgi:hypothetical protein